MTGRTVALGTIAVAASLTLHAAGLWVWAPDAPASPAGAAPQIARLGNSFADLAARLDPARPSDAETLTPTAAAPPQATVSQAAPRRVEAPGQEVLDATAQDLPRVAQTTARATQPRTADPVPTVQPSTAENAAAGPELRRPIRPASPPTLAMAARSTEIAPARPPQRVTATRPAAGERLTQAASTQTLEGRSAVAVQTPTADTPRPQPRIARPERAEPQRPAPPPPAQPRQQAGTSTGQAQGTATQTSQGATGSGATDSAAIARYPSQVNRHLRRVRPPSAAGSGTAVVAFTIDAAGGLAGISVVQSSGNADFDRQALAHIQRAAPFPVPPQGAQRSYQVPVRGR